MWQLKPSLLFYDQVELAATYQVDNNGIVPFISELEDIYARIFEEKDKAFVNRSNKLICNIVCFSSLHRDINQPLSNQMFASCPLNDPYLVSTPKQLNTVYLGDTNLLSSNIQTTNGCHTIEERFNQLISFIFLWKAITN